MSNIIQAPSRTLLRSLRASLNQPTCQCSRSKRLLQQRQQQRWQSSTTSSSLTSSSQASDSSFEPQNNPRWSQTPAAMKAPVRVKPRPATWKAFPVNGDPEVLNAMYSKLLGRNGPKMLSDETKWLAVTHKSFDHGRRGFNDRLSFLGRQIVELQCSLAMLTAAEGRDSLQPSEDRYGRKPFEHPATVNAEVLTGSAKEFILSHVRISALAGNYGLPQVMRWQPRDVDNLEASGRDMVYAQALYAIVGALALEQGGTVANRVARERILQPLGLNRSLLEGDAQQIS